MVLSEMSRGVFYVHRTPRYTYFGIHPQNAKGADLDAQKVKEQLSVLLGWKSCQKLRDCHKRSTNPVKGGLWWEVVGDVKIPKRKKLVDGKMADFGKLFIDMDAKVKPEPAPKAPKASTIVSEGDGDFTSEMEVEIEGDDEEEGEEEEEEEEVPTPTPTPAAVPTPTPAPAPVSQPTPGAVVLLAKARDIVRKSGIDGPTKEFWEVIIAQSMQLNALTASNSALVYELAALRTEISAERAEVRALLDEWRK